MPYEQGHSRELPALAARPRALEEPLCQIAHNAGLGARFVVHHVRKTKNGQGPNAMTGEIGDLVAAGIVDPPDG